ncbi:MAG: diguanylate cyclase (GGDEF)-like protein [Alteromonadaceae bacterium]
MVNLREQNQLLSQKLENAIGQAQQLRGEVLHNTIISSLMNERFNLSKGVLQSPQIQTRFLQTLSLQCHSKSVIIYKLDSQTGYFNLENYYSCNGYRPQSQFITADAPVYISNAKASCCNLAIAPMRFASGINDIHWYYDKSSQYALLITHHDDDCSQKVFNQLTSEVLRTALQLYMDIQTKQNYEAQLIHQATIDPMTQLPNRNLAFDRLGQAMLSRANENKIVFALFVDIAHFKDINESLGHNTGDKVLGILARRIRHAVRESDTVARLSGDEFLIILENANKAKAAETVARNVISAISEPLSFEGRELLVASNVGISAYPGDGDDASMLIKNADAAMYQARKMGVNQYQFYTQAMNEEVAQRLAIETGLQKALQKDEFILHYQPLIDLSSGSTGTVEALIRWNSSELGFVPPDSFIAIAEEDGFIIPIGYWVINEVCRQINVWKKQGIVNLTVAINLSVRQLHEPGFTDRLIEILANHNMTTDKIELEITEGILLSQVNGANHILNKLHQLGFKLSLDDFGTGYSALSYLNSFHFDHLKIDRSFITNLVHNEKDKALIDAIVAMAHKLNLKVIAEGVENVEELDYLQSQNCDYIQGFYFSKPIPANQISEQFFAANLQMA